MPPYSHALPTARTERAHLFRDGHALCGLTDVPCGIPELSPNAFPPLIGFLYWYCPYRRRGNGKRSITVTMEFESDILGEFSESFRFALRGNEEPVPCQFKGHVVSFEFRPSLCVGVVPRVCLLRGGEHFNWNISPHQDNKGRSARSTSGFGRVNWC